MLIRVLSGADVAVEARVESISQAAASAVSQLIRSPTNRLKRSRKSANMLRPSVVTSASRQVESKHYDSGLLRFKLKIGASNYQITSKIPRESIPVAVCIAPA